MAEVVLPAASGDLPEVDGVDGTIMVAGQAGGTPSAVQPCRRCSLYVIHGAYLHAFAAPDAGIAVYGELLVGNHLLVEVVADDVRIESGSGSFLQFLDAAPAVLDDADDVVQLSPGIVYLPALFVLGIRFHEWQADVALGHDDREESLCLKRLSIGRTQGWIRRELAVEDGHGLAHIIAAGGQRPAEVSGFASQRQAADKTAHDSRRLPSVGGEAEPDALALFQIEPVALLPDEIRDIQQLLMDGIGNLLSRPFRITRSRKIEYHGAKVQIIHEMKPLYRSFFVPLPPK